MINEFRPMNHLTSLQNLICTIGNLPTSYALSLSYEEQIWWLCDFLEKKVFPAIEENTNITEETQQAFIELQNYVRDYFNNLDVQEEINNKLDEMAQSGTLEEIIELYLQTNAMITFNNIQDLKNANNLVNGSKCSILSKENINDFEYTVYLVRNKDINDIEKIPNIIFLQNNLVAEMIENPYVNKYYDSQKGLDSFNKLNQMHFRFTSGHSFYKNLKYPLANMDFTTNFAHEEHGNLYALLENTNLTENISNGKYIISNESENRDELRRVITVFNPFTNYSVKYSNINKVDYGCRVGIFFQFMNYFSADSTKRLDLRLFGEKVDNNNFNIKYEISYGEVSQGVQTINTITSVSNIDSLELIALPKMNGNIEVYYKINNDNKIEYLSSIDISEFLSVDRFYRLDIHQTRVCLYCRLGINESVEIDHVENFIDCGISQGDIRPIKYKNGQTLIQDGKVFYTFSARTNNDSYQAIMSQELSSNKFELTGMLFFLVDGKMCNNIASSIKYDNTTGEFLIWNYFMKNAHEIVYGKAYGDILHGINIVKMQKMQHQNEDLDGHPTVSNDELFYAKYGDEDPDFVYNEDDKKWHLIICRKVQEDETTPYRYFHFISDNPFTDYQFVDKTLSGSNTGGSIVKIGGTWYLVCGSNFHTVAQYNIYLLNDLSNFSALTKSPSDGGFRGWGSVFSIPCGSLTKYCFITFDRVNIGEGNWTYGNIYYYESQLYNDGCEYNVKNNF